MMESRAAKGYNCTKTGRHLMLEQPVIIIFSIAFITVFCQKKTHRLCLSHAKKIQQPTQQLRWLWVSTLVKTSILVIVFMLLALTKPRWLELFTIFYITALAFWHRTPWGDGLPLKKPKKTN